MQILSQLEFPSFDYESTLVLFPDDTAIQVSEMKKEDLSKIKNVVLIDSTWN